VLIYGPPQIIAFIVDGQKRLVQMALVAWPGASSGESIGILLAKFSSPIAHGFVRHDDAALGHHLLDVPIAQAEAEIEPDTMADNLRREAVAFVEMRRGWCRHAVRLPQYRFVVGGDVLRQRCPGEQRLYRQTR
jgi:hypothetical protein